MRDISVPAKNEKRAKLPEAHGMAKNELYLQSMKIDGCLACVTEQTDVQLPEGIFRVEKRLNRV